jgi:hypothetical protein
MLAIIAAVIFGVAFLLDLLNEDLGAPQFFNPVTLLLLGMTLLALYLGGIGSGPRYGTGTGAGRRFYGRRPGRG